VSVSDENIASSSFEDKLEALNI